MKTIGFDLDGGDLGSSTTSKSLIKFAKKNKDIKIIAFSKEELDFSSFENITLIKCEDKIESTDGILSIRRKSKSSMVTMLEYAKKKKIDASISAGSSGPLMAGASLIVGNTKDKVKPAFAPMLKSVHGEPVMILDGGANINNTPQELEQYALMGSAIVKSMGYEPKVGLINNGEEETKGDELHLDTFALLKKNKKINFYGNVEPRELMEGIVHVYVTDGFSGNMVVKSYEGMARSMSKEIKRELKKTAILDIFGFIITAFALKRVKKTFDYRTYGGSLILGVKSTLIKCHGESDELAFFNALKFAKTLVENKGKK